MVIVNVLWVFLLSNAAPGATHYEISGGPWRHAVIEAMDNGSLRTEVPEVNDGVHMIKVRTMAGDRKSPWVLWWWTQDGASVTNGREISEEHMAGKSTAGMR